MMLVRVQVWSPQGQFHEVAGMRIDDTNSGCCEDHRNYTVIFDDQPKMKFLVSGFRRSRGVWRLIADILNSRIAGEDEENGRTKERDSSK